MEKNEQRFNNAPKGGYIERKHKKAPVAPWDTLRQEVWVENDE